MIADARSTTSTSGRYKRGMRNTWNPGQYRKFSAERRGPGEDLLALVEAAPGGTAVDLGCGTGELTAQLHRHAGTASTVGIDSSEAMLSEAEIQAGHGLRFERGDINDFEPATPVDVIFSNAALHWVPDHPRLLQRLRDALRPGGQLAVQVPANADHPSHALAFEIAQESPFREALHDAGDRLAEATPVLTAERYAELLDEVGFEEQHVRLQVYGHHLGSTEDVVEWTKATTLTRYERAMVGELYDRFVDRYRARLLAALGERSPYFYTFKRILFRARLPRPG